MKICLTSNYGIFHVLGTRNEGWFDPWLLLSAFKKKIIAMGVHYIKGEVCGVDMGENRVRSVQVKEQNVVLRDLQLSIKIHLLSCMEFNSCIKCLIFPSGPGWTEDIVINRTFKLFGGKIPEDLVKNPPMD